MFSVLPDAISTQFRVGSLVGSVKAGMVRSCLAAILCAAASLPAVAQQPAKAGCTLASLPQSDRTPQTAAAARALANTDPCKVVPGFTAKSLTTVWNTLLSSSRTGGRRLETPVPPGAPQGLMLAQRQVIVFDFNAIAGEQLKSLKVEVEQKPLLNLARKRLASSMVTFSILPVRVCLRSLMNVSVVAVTLSMVPLSHMAVSMQWASKSPVTPLPATLASKRQRPAPPWGRSLEMVQSWRNFAR